MELSLKANLIASCDQFLQAAVKAGRHYFAAVEAPLRDVEIDVMEPTEPGRWRSKPFIHQEIDISRLYEFESTVLHASPEWENAKEAVQAYVDANKIEPIGFSFPNI